MEDIQPTITIPREVVLTVMERPAMFHHIVEGLAGVRTITSEDVRTDEELVSLRLYRNALCVAIDARRQLADHYHNATANVRPIKRAIY